MRARRLMQGFFRHVGYELRRPQPRLPHFLVSRDIDIVLDVGANEGQFGMWLREQGYTGTIVSFEPFEPAFSVLSRHAHRDGNWIVHQIALGQAAGTARLNVSELSVFNSLLQVREMALGIDSRARVTSAQSVPIETLDDLAGEFRNRNCFLKVDTQGSERAIILGGAQALAKMRGVQLELSFLPLYEGEWTLSEALETMRTHGYVPAQVHPVLYHPADAQVWLQADFVFRRIDEAADS